MVYFDVILSIVVDECGVQV